MWKCLSGKRSPMLMSLQHPSLLNLKNLQQYSYCLMWSWLRIWILRSLFCLTSLPHTRLSLCNQSSIIVWAFLFHVWEICPRIYFSISFLNSKRLIWIENVNISNSIKIFIIYLSKVHFNRVLLSIKRYPMLLQL